MNKRLKPEVRKKQLMDAATLLAHLHGYNNVKQVDIAQLTGVTACVINHYWGTMTQLKRAIMRSAIKNEDLVIIAQGLALGNKQSKKTSKELQVKAIQGLID